MENTKKTNKNTVLLGAHMSIAGGFYKALERGVSIGCNTIQIFSHSNRQWKINDITQEQSDKFKQVKKQLNLKHIVVHSSYLVNLGSTTEETVNKSIETLKKELTQCKQLEIPYLVVHTGSGYKDNPKIGLDQIIKNINLVLNLSDNKETIVLFENMAGQGASLGSSLEQLSYIFKNIEKSNKNRVGICFDTCHAWAAGYDFSEKSKYQNFWKEFDQKIGLEKLKVIHLNNSKTKLNSRVDRHAKINEGTMPIKTFSLIMNDCNLKDIPKVLEVPVESYKEYEAEIEKLKNLITKT